MDFYVIIISAGLLNEIRLENISGLTAVRWEFMAYLLLPGRTGNGIIAGRRHYRPCLPGRDTGGHKTGFAGGLFLPKANDLR